MLVICVLIVGMSGGQEETWPKHLTKKEFVPASGSEYPLSITEGESRNRQSQWAEQVFRRAHFPGNVQKRKEVRRLGLGVPLPVLARHQPLHSSVGEQVTAKV